MTTLYSIPPISRRKGYVPSLSQLSAMAESNYVRLSKLLPDQKAGTQLTFSLRSSSHPDFTISITIEEVHRYTTMLRMEHIGTSIPGVPAMRLHIRLYHDAGMAEVIRYQNRKVSQGAYQYPNASMHHPDEKAQWNQFLTECLEHCLAKGHTELMHGFTNE